MEKNPFNDYRKRSKSYLNSLVFLIIASVIFFIHFYVLLNGIPFMWKNSQNYGSSRCWLMLILGVIYYVRFVFLVLYLLSRVNPKEEIIAVSCVYVFVTTTFSTATLFWSPKSIGLKDIFFVLLYLLGSYINTYSEYDRKQFKLNPQNKGKLFTTGLFSLSRHVNYFGDLMMFTCWSLISGNLFSLIVPLVMLVNFLYVIIPEHEEYLSGKYPKFGLYKKKTKKFVPFIY